MAVREDFTIRRGDPELRDAQMKEPDPASPNIALPDYPNPDRAADWRNKDVSSGYTFKGQCKTQAGALLANFSIDMTNAATGKVVFSLSGTDTTNLQDCDYEWQWTYGGSTFTFQEGRITMVGQVTT